jgi:hypothetical protein
MASLNGKLLRASKSLCRISSRKPSLTSSLCRRSLATSSILRFQNTSRDHQLAEVPADKYQRTTITEDVRRAAAGENWPDPRRLPSDEQKADEEMMDPTIRHFTVNFVCLPFPVVDAFLTFN